jgi:hypothetical protein
MIAIAASSPMIIHVRRPPDSAAAVVDFVALYETLLDAAEAL